MNIKKSQLSLLLVGALLIGFFGAYVGMTLADQNEELVLSEEEIPLIESPEELGKINQAYGLIKENYLEDVDDTVLIEGAIEGMLATLEDPHTSYLNLDSMDEFTEQMESSFEGIGAEVSMVNEIVTIVSPIKDSPAEKAGLRPNDQILSVDGDSLKGLNLNEAVAKIRGEKGSKVTLEVMRATSSDPFNVDIVRDTIPVETVYGSIKEVDGKSTALIEITNFSEGTAVEFEEQLDELEKSGFDGLVIDVRGNPGGLLHVVEDMLALLVPKTMPYLQIEDANGNVQKFYSDLTEEKAYPISILIDEGSASASEILAIALKELGYDVVGHNSYGKGTVQTAVPLGDGSSIKLTTFKWLSPKGEWIDEVGVEPTVEVDQPDYYYTTPVSVEETSRIDDTNEAIANIQVMLRGLGYDAGREDGYFSEETKVAVETFQADNNLTVTGEIDTETAGVVTAKLIEKIRSGEDDKQLEAAINVLYE